MKPGIVAIAFMLLTLAAQNVFAGRLGLLLYSDISQSVGVSYQFNRVDVSNNETTQNQFFEDYRISGKYGIYNTHFLHGNYSFGLQLNQSNYNSTILNRTDNSSAILYSINGIFGDRSPYPVTFTVQSTINEVSRDFANPYTTTSENYGVGVSLLSRYLPVSFNYNRVSNETSGLALDTTSTVNQFQFKANHGYGVSQTQLLLSGSTNNSKTVATGDVLLEERFYEAALDNNLTFGGETRNIKFDNYISRTEEAGTYDFKMLNIRENVYSRLGKALTAGLLYSYSDLSRNNNVDDSRTHYGNLWLQHDLFKSLQTRLDFTVDSFDFKGGNSQDIFGRVGLAYNKVLPNDSHLLVNAYEQYGVTDRNLTNNTLPVIDELHLVPPSRQVTLKNENVLPGTIVVLWVQQGTTIKLPLNQGPVPDYTVEPNPLSPLQTNIVLTATTAVQPGDTLLVSYSYRVNGDISFSTDSHGISANLNLFSNKYSVRGTWDSSHQTLLSGIASSLSLLSQDKYTLYFDTTYRNIAMTLGYVYVDSNQINSWSVLGNAHYQTLLGSGLVTLALEATQTEFETKDLLVAVNSSGSQTSFNAWGTYNRRILSGAIMNFMTRYMFSSGTVDRNDLSFSLDIRWVFSKLQLALLGQVNMRGLDKNMVTDEHVLVSVRRSF